MGFNVHLLLFCQALLVDVRDKLLFEQEYAGSKRAKVPPRSSLHIPWSWLPAALCVLQEVMCNTNTVQSIDSYVPMKGNFRVLSILHGIVTIRGMLCSLKFTKTVNM